MTVAISFFRPVSWKNITKLFTTREVSVPVCMYMYVKYVCNTITFESLNVESSFIFGLRMHLEGHTGQVRI